jgi:hypothetical protein
MTAAVLLGSGLGLGLWALAVWLTPPRPTLGVVLQRATGPAPDPTLTARTGDQGSRRGRSLTAPLILLLTGLLRASGLPTTSVRRDLTVLERPVDSYLVEKAMLTLAGLLVPSSALAALGAFDGGIGLRMPLAVAAGCALAGFVIPDLRVRRRAARLRADFRHALSAYLDLVVISLAGGAGVDSALHDSLTAGHGWAFRQLDRALSAARLTRATPWLALNQLGTELDISELTELAASVSLAGTEGARVRQSLAAKAAALRGRELTDAETAAGEATEHMSLPVVALLLGFLVFVAYPAVSQVLTGL